MAAKGKDLQSNRTLREKRHKTLYQVTAILIAVYVIAALATYFIYNRSQDRLIDESREKLIQMEVENAAANSSFVIDYLVLLGGNKLRGMDAASLAAAEAAGGLTPGQEYLNDKLANMVDAGFMGLEAAAVFLLPGGSTGAEVVAASDGSRVFVAEMPESVTGACAEGSPYMWSEDGLPQLGIHGKSLLVTKRVSLGTTGLAAGYVAVKPMQAEVEEIESFFSDKKKAGSRNLASLCGISIAAMSLLTLAFLAFLIQRRITRPINELSSAATEVMAGDLEKKVPVRNGDEFEGLERALNTMVGILNSILSGSQVTGKGEGPNGRQEENPTQAGRRDRRRTAAPAPRGVRPARSRTLLYITLFLVAMFLASGLACFLVFNHWQNDIIDEGRNELVRAVSDYFINASHYIRGTLDPVITEKMREAGMKDPDITESFALMREGKTSDYQDFYIQFCEQLVDIGALGMERVMVVLTGGLVPGGATVVVSDKAGDVYNWPVPDYLLEAIREGEPYLYFEGGIPELGLEGEYIMAIETFDFSGLTQAYIGVKSMRAEMAELRGFYDHEKGYIYLALIPVMAGALIALVLLTFLVMRYFIRRNITAPVDELSAAMARVMEGDLEVEITVREGEELESLERAFREMVESFRRLMERATE
jgi:HAMP domain-containing protein/preprotein translocase subunit SecG